MCFGLVGVCAGLSVGNEELNCPFCRGLISVEALTCKHCGKTVQQAVAEEDQSGPLWAESQPIGSIEPETAADPTPSAHAASIMSNDAPSPSPSSAPAASPPAIVSADETPSTTSPGSGADDAGASPIVALDKTMVQASPQGRPPSQPKAPPQVPPTPQPKAPPPLTTPGPSTAPPVAGTQMPPPPTPTPGAGNEPIANPQKIDPVLAAILSGCCICGLGQMLIGQVEKGIVILVGSMIIGFCTFGLGSLLILPLAAVDAYLSASKVKRGEVLRKWDWF